MIDGRGGDEGKMGQGEECVCALGRRYMLVGTIDSPAARVQVGQDWRSRVQETTTTNISVRRARTCLRSLLCVSWCFS